MNSTATVVALIHGEKAIAQQVENFELGDIQASVTAVESIEHIMVTAINGFG